MNYPPAELFLLWANSHIMHTKMIDDWFDRNEDEFFKSMPKFFMSLDNEHKQDFINKYNMWYEDNPEWQITLDKVLKDMPKFAAIDNYVEQYGLTALLEHVYGHGHWMVEYFMNKVSHINKNLALMLYIRCDPCNKQHFINRAHVIFFLLFFGFKWNYLNAKNKRKKTKEKKTKEYILLYNGKRFDEEGYD